MALENRPVFEVRCGTVNSGAPDILTLRRWLIVGIGLLLAVVTGYLLSDPFRYTSLGFVAALTALLLSPVLIRHYHPLLVYAWNMNMVVFFFPGQPSIGWVLSGIGFAIALLNRSLNHSKKFITDRDLTRSILILVGVFLLNAYVNGGLGLRVMGSNSYGGRKYAILFGAVAGFFALTSQSIPAGLARHFCSVHFLGALTAVVSYVVYFAGPAFYLLFYIFPPEMMSLQSLEWGTPGQEGLVRFAALGSVSTAICATLQLRYGVRHLLSVRGFPLLLIYLAAFAAGMLGGFRSVTMFNVMLFGTQFVIEGLHRTRRLLVLLLCIGIATTALVPFVNKLPYPVQRSLAFLPLDIDPMARMDAEASANWRFEMWAATIKGWKSKWVFGKGYAIDPTDLYFAEEGVRRGILPSFEPALIAGDYHSGPLSVLIPFGAVGMAAFLLLLGTGFRVMLKHWRESAPELRNINALLLAFYVSKVVFFFAVFGSISPELGTFLGLLGLSLCINRQVPGQRAEPASSTLP